MIVALKETTDQGTVPLSQGPGRSQMVSQLLRKLHRSGTDVADRTSDHLC